MNSNPEHSDPQNKAQSLVSARSLGVRRDDRWLIKDVDLSVSRGEIVTLIGPNGGGKTTTARALLGLVDADAGQVERHPDLKIGYVPQRFEIDRTLPLKVARMIGLTHPYSAETIRSALARVGGEHLVDRDVQNLSGGEFQRVLLARAIAGNPDLLVLDEPVQGVDYAGEIALYELITRIRNELGCGILLISHDLHIVMAETDSVLCLNGHVCCSGSPQQVIANDEYKRLFGARGASALAIYQHHHDHVHDPLDGHCDHEHDEEHDHAG